MSCIFIAAREETAGSDVCVELNKELGTTNIEFHQLDITSKESIHKLRDHVHDKFGGLDVLINNSAVLLKVHSMNKNYETIFGTIKGESQGFFFYLTVHSLK